MKHYFFRGCQFCLGRVDSTLKAGAWSQYTANDRFAAQSPMAGLGRLESDAVPTGRSGIAALLPLAADVSVDGKGVRLAPRPARLVPSDASFVWAIVTGFDVPTA